MEKINQVAVNGQNYEIEDKVARDQFSTIKNLLDNISELPIKKGTGKNSLIIGDIENNISDGENSIASGTKHKNNTITKASEKGAHAFGIGAQAISRGSFAEGVRTIAGDIYREVKEEACHAEGYKTGAFGGSSHAEGGKINGCPENRAYAYGSHVEGASTTAFGRESHSEGFLNLAYGNYSHIEGTGVGYHTVTIPTIIFNSENKQIIIADDYTSINITSAIRGGAKAIIEGAIIIINNKFFNVTKVELVDNNTVVTVQEDVQTIENIDYFAIYNKGLAIGVGSHVEGGGSKAIGDYSHVEGGICIASEKYSHAEGIKTIASGYSSHAEGNYTNATNKAEHAQGTYNKSNTGETSDLQTIHSIGIGSSENDRKNAVEVMGNGDAYLYGVGNYDGTNPTAAKRLQDIINNIPEQETKINNLENRMGGIEQGISNLQSMISKMLNQTKVE